MDFVLHNKTWFRGHQQRQRAIAERKRLYGNEGVVISRNEGYSHKQASTVFRNAEDVYEFIKKMEYINDKFLYEIIEDKSVLFFDIDSECNDDLTLEDVVAHVYDIIKCLYSVVPNKHVVLSASRKGKLSWHILFPEYYIDSNERVLLSEYIKANSNYYVDWHVYNKTQALRLHGCYKPGDLSSRLKFVNDKGNINLNINEEQFISTMATQIQRDAVHLNSHV